MILSPGIVLYNAENGGVRGGGAPPAGPKTGDKLNRKTKDQREEKNPIERPNADKHFADLQTCI